MRAPPESLRPITGAPTFIAWSMTLQIFSAWVSDSEPPKTVKSLREDEHQTAVDGAVADHDAVAGIFSALSMPKSVQRCSLNRSHSSKAGIEQQLDAFAGRQVALGVLAVDAFLATAEAGHFALFPAV